MATITRIGRADHGRPMTLDEFMHSSWDEGYRYELIDGKLYVSPQPNQPENWVAEWLSFLLKLYARAHPRIVNHVSCGARVFIPSRPRITVPEPDVAAYRNYPVEQDFREIRWQDVSPILVAEVLSDEDPAKDLVRNVELYLQVPSVKEYWVFDTREDPEHAFFRAHRRHGRRWRTFDHDEGETYETRLLPDFALLLDPRR